MKQRLQKVIAQAGLASRRKAEELILEGKVKVNGIIVKELGTQVDSNDSINVSGKTISFEDRVTYLINKPARVLSSSSDDRDRICVVDLIKDKRRLFPVGRLDYQSTGLLLVSNDGELTNLLTHPKHEFSKQYHVKIRGTLTESQKLLVEKGLQTKEEKYLPAQINNIKVDSEKKQTHFDITLHEGKNREIRKMMEHFHHEVIKLHRFAFGPLEIGKLASGSYRKLTEEETRMLKLLAKKR